MGPLERLIGSLYIYIYRYRYYTYIYILIYSEAGGAAGRPGGAGRGQQGTARGGEPGRGQEATKAIARRYFDFFRDVPRGIIGFEAISGRGGRPEGPILTKSFGGGPANLKNFRTKTSIFDNPFSIFDKSAFLEPF